jgi:hypothetical protein
MPSPAAGGLSSNCQVTTPSWRFLVYLTVSETAVNTSGIETSRDRKIQENIQGGSVNDSTVVGGAGDAVVMLMHCPLNLRTDRFSFVTSLNRLEG